MWDLANGFGFAALAGLIYLSVQGRQRKLQQIHKHFSYAVTIMVAAHVLILLSTDAVVINYVLPGAPLYMWAGTLALFLLIFIVLSSVPGNRKRCFNELEGFRAWHKPLSWLLIASVVYHIIGSGFYFRSVLQWCALILLLAPLLLSAKHHDRIGLRSFSPVTFLLGGSLASGLLALVLNWQTV